MKKIPLRKRDGSIRAYALVDAADFPSLQGYRWHLCNGYVARKNSLQQNVYMHRELLGLSSGDGLEGDHKNRNKLDNRRSNLRVGGLPDNRQNLAASGYQTWAGRKTSSKYRGVSVCESGRWRAYAKGKHLGRYDSEEEAARVAAAARAEAMPWTMN